MTSLSFMIAFIFTYICISYLIYFNTHFSRWERFFASSMCCGLFYTLFLIAMSCLNIYYMGSAFCMYLYFLLSRHAFRKIRGKI